MKNKIYVAIGAVIIVLANLIRECEYFRRICEIKFGNIGQAGADIRPSNNRN